MGRHTRLLKSSRHPPSYYQELWSTITSGKTWTGRLVNRCKDDSLVEVDATISPIFAPQGGILGFVSVKRDITEQVKMEQHLRQAQKMEAIGQLAGGVAHDGQQAMDVFCQHADRIDLALLDVVMPHKSGRSVCEEIRALKPALPILFSSGYGRAHLGADFEPQEGMELLHKPFEPNELLAKVREVMKR